MRAGCWPLRSISEENDITMSLIDWAGVARNALWILGLSIVLAAWSYVTWDAGQRRVRLRRAVTWPLLHVPVTAGLLLFSISLCWGARALWERIAWAALALAFVWQMVMGWRAAHSGGWRPE